MANGDAMFGQAATFNRGGSAFASLLSGTVSEPPWLVRARTFIGFHETGNNRGIEQFISEAKTGS